MALVAGTRLGPYEIVAALGAGGMGEVYKARDTRLDRTVAIKVLPDDVSQDRDLRARFEREARAIAALDHPHICALHDVGEHEGTLYLVMQHLEGETLAARLARTKGPLPLDQALKIATEIADALDKAHRAGITHRDVKPANIMLTKTGATLLDFGLAKLRGPAAPISMSGMTRLATSTPNTAHGTILGTVHYMAPEQVEGHEADARSDIWALGTVIYEMTTGRRPFDGESPASIIGSILKDTPPPISSRQPLSPLALDHVVGRCLDKDPDERWQTAGDLMRELRWWMANRGSVAGAPARSPSVRQARLAWFIAAGLGGIAVLLLVLLARSRVGLVNAPILRFAINAPPESLFSSPPATVPSTQLALSPDGRWLAFVAEREAGDAILWIRPIDGLVAQPLMGTEEASYPFWSPDSRSIAFFAQSKLKRIDLPTGSPQVVCAATDPRGGAWGPDNLILFGQSQTGLLRVSANGGEPVTMTKLAPTHASHRWPSFLPDGQHVIFFALTQSRPDSFVGVAAIETGEYTQLFRSQYGAQYVTAGSQLLSMSDGSLIAQHLDPSRRVLTGQPVTISQDVAGSSVSHGSFSASDTGLLAFAPASSTQTQLAWFARDGKRLANVGPAGDYGDVQLSPDGRRVLVTHVEAKSATSSIWAVELSSGLTSPLTFDPFVNAQPVWSPDGRALVFRAQRELPAPMVRQASGAGSTEVVFQPRTLPDKPNVFPTDWSADGKFILFHAAFRETGYDVWALPMAGDHAAFPFVQTRADDIHARFSPDGRFVAYSSAESGHFQVYVQPFPNPEGKWQISTAGGAEPRWRSDDRELFFVGADRRLMAVPVTTTPSFEHGVPVALFSTHSSVFANPFRTSYAVSRDGQQFLLNAAAENASMPSITVVSNWLELLKK